MSDIVYQNMHALLSNIRGTNLSIRVGTSSYRCVYEESYDVTIHKFRTTTGNTLIIPANKIDAIMIHKEDSL